MKTRPGRPPTTTPKNGHLKNRSFEAASLLFRRTAGRNSSVFWACPYYSLKNEWWVDGVPTLRPRVTSKRKLCSILLARTVYINGIFRRGFHFTVERTVPCTLFVGLNKRYVSHLLTNKNTFYVAGIHTDFFYCRVICMHFSLHSLEKKGISRLHGTVDLHNNITKSTHFLFSEASP